MVATGAPATAQSSMGTEAFLGVWEVAAVGKLSCRLQLRGDEAGQGFGLGAPPACRRALPALAPVARWKPMPDGTLALSGTDDKPLVEFGAPDEKGVRKGSAGGQDYTMAPVALRKKAETKPKAGGTSGAAAPVQATAVAPPPVEPAAGAPEPQAMPGRYAVLRSQGRSGCTLTLGTAAAGADRFVAGLGKGCQDKGMMIFSPVAWRYAGGQLTLTAAKGHEVTLVFTREGFRKDPPSGAELRLTREP